MVAAVLGSRRPVDLTLYHDAIMKNHREAPCSSAVIECAYEEFCIAEEQGVSIDPGEFAKRFPGYTDIILEHIDCHRIVNARLLTQRSQFDFLHSTSHIAHYKLLRLLGEGGFSKVFLARDEHLCDRLVVIKFSNNLASDVSCLSRLDHPSIVPLLSRESDSDSGVQFVTMPFLGTHTLLDFIRFRNVEANRRLPVGEAWQRFAVEAESSFSDVPDARRYSHNSLTPRGSNDLILRWAAEIAEALAAAHAAGIVHRDVKPSNVLLGFDGRARLIDFNLASVANNACRAGGTIPYMAPEQLSEALGEMSAISPLSDLYSFGLVMHEAWTGQLPFEADFTENRRSVVLAHHLEHKRQMPLCDTFDNLSLSSELRLVFQQCLHFQAERRPRSASRILELLNRELLAANETSMRNQRTRTLFIGAGIALACSASLFAMGVAYEPSYDSSLKRAVNDISRLKVLDAARTLQSAVIHVEGDHRALVGLAGLAMLEGRFTEAALHLEDVPKSAAVLRWYAFCKLAESRDLREALFAYTDLLASGQCTSGDMINASYCFQRIGDLDTAESLLRHIASQVSESPSYIFSRLSLSRRLAARMGTQVPSGVLANAEKIAADCPERWIEVAFSHAVNGRLAEENVDESELTLPVECATRSLIKCVDLGVPSSQIKGVVMSWQRLRQIECELPSRNLRSLEGSRHSACIQSPVTTESICSELQRPDYSVPNIIEQRSHMLTESEIKNVWQMEVCGRNL